MDFFEQLEAAGISQDTIKILKKKSITDIVGLGSYAAEDYLKMGVSTEEEKKLQNFYNQNEPA